MNNPENKTNSTINYQRQVMLKSDTDIVIVGGGMAGISAACMASLQGNRTILIENAALLGGIGVNGGMREFCGETKGQGRIFDEIITRLEKCHAVASYFPAKNKLFEGRHYDHAMLGLILQEMVLSYNVTLLLHTRVIDVIHSEKVLTHVLIADKDGIQAIQAKVFIDCTGESDLVRFSGGAVLNQEPQEGRNLPMGLMFFVQTNHFYRKIPLIDPSQFPWTPIRNKKELPHMNKNWMGKSEFAWKLKVPGFDGTKADQLTQAEIEGHRKLARVLYYYQHKLKRKWRLTNISPLIGIREGNRVLGEYILTVEDVRKGAEFEDAIAVGVYVLDAHDPTNEQHTYIVPKSELRVPPYQIPFRCLVPKGYSNLLIAGRNLSADQLAMSSARQMTTCSMMGHASGVAASLLIKYKCTNQELINKNIPELQKILKESSVIIDRKFYL